MCELREIKEDLFDVAHRLREIDGRYVLYRNLRLNRFEIHANGVLQIVVPFAELDARTVELARSTRLEYADKLMRRLDEENDKLQRAEGEAKRTRIMEEVERTL
ncbi:MAG: hypothetical protein K2J16_06690 [Clostridia bacterium]|nr:hypothetical protein [Clostridia bacterium]